MMTEGIRDDDDYECPTMTELIRGAEGQRSLPGVFNDDRADS